MEDSGKISIKKESLYIYFSGHKSFRQTDGGVDGQTRKRGGGAG